MIGWIFSWLASMVLISILLALMGDKYVKVLERRQGLGAFFLFIAPTVIETASFIAKGTPFWF